MTLAEYLRLKRWGTVERESGDRIRRIETEGGVIAASVRRVGIQQWWSTSVNATDILADDWKEIAP